MVCKNQGGKNFMKICEFIRDLWEDENAVGVVEIILILVVLIGLVAVFKSELTDIVERIFRNISKGTKSILE